MRSQLDRIQKENTELREELNALHLKNDDFKLEVSNLQEQLSASEQLQQDLISERDGATEDCKRLKFENEYLLADRDRAEAASGEQRKQLVSVRSQLEDQATKAGQWYEKAKLAQEEIQRLQSRPIAAVDPDVLTKLHAALQLKANAGGAIKDKIREALALLAFTNSR